MAVSGAGNVTRAGERSGIVGVLGRFARSRQGGILAFVLLALAGWQLTVPLLVTEQLPLPADVASYMWDELRMETLAPYSVYEAFATTLQRLMWGLVWASIVGLPLGLMMGWSRRVEAFFHDWIFLLLASPALIWALILSLWFGFTNVAPIATVTLVVLPYIVMNVSQGVKDVPIDLLDMGRSFQVPRRTMIRHVIVPSQMPFLFAALRYGFANGWKGLLVAEVFSSDSGAGWMIRYWYEARRAYAVIGYALFFVLIALILERVFFQALSNRVFRWRPSIVEGASAKATEPRIGAE